MDASRMTRLIALFERALEVPRERRPAFVDEAAGDDAGLREELRSLLDANETATGYFDGLSERLVSPAYAAVSGAAHRVRESALLPQVQAALGDSYRVVRGLGGGMSGVFLAEETRLGRKVVIKVLPPEMAAGASAERFRREIQLAAQLQHPHIVPLLTSDRAGDLLYYTMPFVAGESLRARLLREGALPLADAWKIWRDVLDALVHAHANGVVHRDIKPGNILLSARNALVSDFGIARAMEAASVGAASVDGSDAAAGPIVGTPAYLAPEQVAGHGDADHRVDIYAAGLVMYEMLEGRQPFAGDSVREVILARLTHEASPVTRADCPRELVDLVAQCLARAPDARPRSAEAILVALESLPATAGPASALPKPDTELASFPGASGAEPVYPSAGPPTGAARRRPRQRILAYGLGFLAVAGASFGASRFMNKGPGGASVAAPPAPSVAVMPLRHLGPEPEVAALADGVTDELLAALSRAGNLRVVPGRSAVALWGSRVESREIAESLRVSHLLDGGLQTAGGRLHLQVNLVDARAGATRWSETYDREMGDVIAVQEDVARQVTRALGARLTWPGPGRHKPSPAAHEWYLRAMQLPLRRSKAGLRQALDYLDRAIAADSSFAAAFAAQVRIIALESGSVPGDYRERHARAMQAALKAVALDSSLAEAHVALGDIRQIYWQWAPAESSFKRALQLDPNVPRAWEGLARLHMWAGRNVEQLAAARTGLAADPYSYSALREMALALSTNGRCDEAIPLLRPLNTLTPPAGVGRVITGQCHAAKGRWKEAIAEFDSAMVTDAKAPLAFRAYALARSGQAREARRILEDMLAGRKYSLGAFGIATVYLGLRDFDQAVAFLDSAITEQSLRSYVMGPMFEDLRRDPRFEQVRKRLGLSGGSSGLRGARPVATSGYAPR